MLKLSESQFKATLSLALFGLIQTPLISNIQLLTYKAALFPTFKSMSLIDSIFLLIASAYLIDKVDTFSKKEWWAGFAVMMIPYFALKWMGVYYDHTNYMIANSEGRSIGGGAAMGHLWLIFYLLGPSQLVSYLGTLLAKRFP